MSVTTPPSSPWLEHAILAELQALDEPGQSTLLLELIELYLSDTPDRAAKILAAIAAGDAQTMHREAHTLKSSSGNLGGKRLQGLCFELETLGRSGHLEGASAKAKLFEEAYRETCAALKALIPWIKGRGTIAA